MSRALAELKVPVCVCVCVALFISKRLDSIALIKSNIGVLLGLIHLSLSHT